MPRQTFSALAILAAMAWPLAAPAQDAVAPPLTEMTPAPSGLQPLSPATADTAAPAAAQTTAAPPATSTDTTTPPAAAATSAPAPAPAAAPAAPPAPPTPVETAVRGWIAAIDASPDWSASVGGVTVDPTSGNATVRNLAISADKPGFTIVIGGITIDGWAAGAANLFTAREIDVTNARIDAGDYSVRIDHAAVMAPVLPTSGGARWDDAQPAASLIGLVTAALSASAQSATADKITVVETVAGVATWSTYANVKLTDFAGGKISALTAGPLHTDSPGSDPAGPPANASQIPLVSLSVANSETHDVDLAAMLIPFQSGGDTSWHQAIGRVVYSGIGVTVPGIAVKMDDIAFENFVVRHPTLAAPPPASDPTTTSTADTVRAIGAALSPFGVGRLSVDKVTFTGTGLDGVHIGNLTLVDASTDSIGAFSLSDMGGAVTGQAKLAIGRIAFGGLKLPDFGTIADVITTALAGGDAKYSTAVPTLDYGEIAGVDVAITNAPELKLGHLRLDLGQWVDKIPTRIGAALAGLDVPAAIIPSDVAQRLLAEYGYDRVELDGGGTLTWGADGSISVRDASLAMKDAGGVSGQADLVGPAPADAEHLAVAKDLLGKLSLKAGTATLSDASLAERLLAAQAAKLNVNGDTFRAQFAKSVPFMLMLLGNRDLIMKVSPVIQTFLTTGGSVTATAAPAAPVPLSQVADTAKGSPWSLFSLLNVNLTGVAGTATTLPSLPTPPPAPAVATAPTATDTDTDAEP